MHVSAFLACILGFIGTMCESEYAMLFALVMGLITIAEAIKESSER